MTDMAAVDLLVTRVDRIALFVSQTEFACGEPAAIAFAVIDGEQRRVGLTAEALKFLVAAARKAP